MQNVTLRARGLYTFPNTLSEIPEGSLIDAESVVIDRDGVITSRRGFKVYGTEMTGPSTRAKQLAVYKGRIIRHWLTTLDFDSDALGTFLPFSGTINEVQTGTKIKYLEANGNFYFTTAQGIKKISTATAAALTGAAITDSGGVKALDGTVQLDATLGSGFLQQDSAVAYRIVWGFKDANTNLILGTPSERIIAVNALIDLLVVDYNGMVTDLSTVAAADGGDALSDADYATLVIPTNASAATILTALQFLASKLDTDLGTLDYTSITAPPVPSDPATTSQLEAIQAYYDAIVAELNTEPGISVTAYAAIGGAFSSSTESVNTNVTFTIPASITEQFFYQVYRSSQATSTGTSTIFDIVPDDELRLVFENNPTAGEIAAASVTYNDTVPDSFRDGGANLYTNANTGEGILQANEPPPIALDISLFRGFVFYGNTKTRHKRQLALLGVSSLLGETITITKGVDTLTLNFSATENAATQDVYTSTAATPAQQVDETARSLVRVINKQPSPIIYAYYISGQNDVPGLMVFESTTLDSVPFSITSSSGASDKFNPNLPTSGTSVSSDNEVSPNRLYYSKYQQPEAVPLLNYIDIGPKDSQILRVLSLRESLFIITEGAVYRLAGDTTTNFVVSLFDSSARLVAPETAVVLSNQIYMLTNQGVVTVSDTGTTAVSRAIEDKFLTLLGDAFTNFSTASFAVAYESDRSYMLWTVLNPTDVYPTMCYRYNTFTQTWVQWTHNKTAGVINPAEDKLFLGAGDINFTEVERKDFNRLDHADREYIREIPINGVSDKTIDFGAIFNFEANDVVVQTQYLTISQFNRLLKRLDLDNGVTDQNYYSTLGAVAGDKLRDALTALATKLDADAGVSQSDFSTAISGYGDDFIDEQDAFNVIVTKLNADPNTTIKNYHMSTGTVEWEDPVAEVTTNTVILAYTMPFIAGPITQYKKIDSFVVWAPAAMGDVSLTKQVSEATIIFETINFRNAIASYASDLSRNFDEIAFNGEGSGIWGNDTWGLGIWGGEATARPFRTLIPRNKQRCRYMNCKFEHSAAFEKYAIFGISYTYNGVSQRGYR